MRWYHSDSSETFALEHHLYVQLCAEAALLHGGVHVTTREDGAAVWYPPDGGVSDEDYNTFKFTMRKPDKMDRLSDLAEACDVFRPNEAHWTLELLGVDPNAQNAGIGSNLMAFGLENANHSKMPVFLASSNRKNLPFYRRFGFDVLAEVNLDGLPTMFPMIRKPSPFSN
ncbi:GNAT family N-acetyltransferase [Ruegeria conchae]|uniref:GNAT family N-acetyltransferase n=1 Tax=Ruegeria conchae TaxID=981384 RepID=UPI0021A8C5A4|nr:GNAT family N-acetyltransferase [Ruegeria conchae]UWR03977.1 GNAT family N-acetyltransferase [Ruegeria conchae]